MDISDPAAMEVNLHSFLRQVSFNSTAGDEIFVYQNGATHPLSVCNDNCHSGYSKQKKEGNPFCCYDWIPCSKGKISTLKGESCTPIIKEDYIFFKMLVSGMRTKCHHHMKF
ncbi:hypothetical protein E2320_003041 [Naja naja]|nr:hypothetical protein E2320_003041 [Naja naja]